MFVNVRLFTKRDNKISDPNPSWHKKSTVYCSGELNHGLGKKIVWSASNPLALHKVIEFYNLLAATEPGSSQYNYSFENNGYIITISWAMYKSNKVDLAIHRSYNTSKEEVLRISASNVSLHALRHEFYLSVMKILTSHTNNDICTKVGAQFYKDSANILEFTMGQKVKTILSSRVKTERMGFVIGRFYHEKDKTNMYYLLVNGRVLYRTYLPGDLEKI